MADTPPSPPRASDAWRSRLGRYRENILDKLLPGVPIALAAKLVDWIAGGILRQPWQAVWFLIPLAVAAWIAARAAKGQTGFRLTRSYLTFLSAYVLFFFTASATDFLDWSRELTVFRQQAPKSWFAPPAAGDWRYKLVRKKEAPPLALVTMDPAQPGADARYDLVRLITIASRAGASGIALDFYFEEKSDIDPLLCNAIQTSGIPVLAGYSFRRIDGQTVPTTMPESLQSCIPAGNQGHLAGFLDVDGVARFVPLFFENNERLPVLSLQVARLMTSESKRQLETPGRGLLRYVEPAGGFTEVSYRNLFERPELRGLLKGRFVLAGENSEKETFPTPLGRKLGVRIHAEAAHCLINNGFIRETPWWLSLLFILVFIYWLASLAAQGASLSKLVRFCLFVSLGIFGVAALMIAAGPWWFPVVYPLAALWLLLPLLLGFRKLPVAGAASPR